MQRLTLAIPTAGFVPGDTFDVFGSVDAAGRALAAIDFSRSVIGGRRAFWPLTPAGAAAPADGPETIAVETVELYCGRYAFAVMTYDRLGNAAAGTPVEFVVAVNSGPRIVDGFKQTAVAADGRPVFAVQVPEQLEQ